MCKALHWGCNARDLSCYQQMPQLFPVQLRSGGGISYSVVQKAQAGMAFHNRHCILVQESPLLPQHHFPQGGQGHARLTGDSGVWSSEVLSPIPVSTTAGPESCLSGLWEGEELTGAAVSTGWHSKQRHGCAAGIWDRLLWD